MEYVLGKEFDQRDANRIKLVTMTAYFPHACTLDGFDLAAQSAVDLGIIRELVKMQWAACGESVLFLGSLGVGKTHLATALGREAVKKGYSVLFITAAALVNMLEKAKKESVLNEKMAMLESVLISVGGSV